MKSFDKCRLFTKEAYEYEIRNFINHYSEDFDFLRLLYSKIGGNAYTSYYTKLQKQFLDDFINFTESTCSEKRIALAKEVTLKRAIPYFDEYLYGNE